MDLAVSVVIFLRCWLTRENSGLEVVAINDTSDPKTNSHLLRYDSMLGRLDADIQAAEDSLIVNGKTIKCTSDRNPQQFAPWGAWDIDLVIESTGVFCERRRGFSPHRSRSEEGADYRSW